jgi:hypothetical protein
VRQAERDGGKRPGLTTSEREHPDDAPGANAAGDIDCVKTDGPSPEITDLRCPLFSDVLVH